MGAWFLKNVGFNRARMHFYSVIINFLPENFPLKTVTNRNSERIDRRLLKKRYFFSCENQNMIIF